MVASLRSLQWILAGEALLALVILTVPFGFDHPSSLGLDFGHLLLVVALYAALVIAGMVVAAKRRNWPVLGVQILTPCLALGLGFLGILRL